MVIGGIGIGAGNPYSDTYENSTIDADKEARTAPEPESTNPNGYDMSNYSDSADLYDDYEDDFEDEEEAEDYYDDYGE